ncbi:MAG: tRNA(Ile2) C34 agmatinyltransferase TiaS [Bacillariaceae sp.]
MDFDSLTEFCAKVQKQNTTTTQTTSNQMNQKRKQKQYTDNKNPATCEYKDEGDDVQDYSDRGLKYNNDTTQIWRLSGEAVVDIGKFKKGRGMLHASVATH